MTARTPTTRSSATNSPYVVAASNLNVNEAANNQGEGLGGTAAGPVSGPGVNLLGPLLITGIAAVALSGAFDRSLVVQPIATEALIGLGLLANARHDFTRGP